MALTSCGQHDADSEPPTSPSEERSVKQAQAASPTAETTIPDPATHPPEALAKPDSLERVAQQLADASPHTGTTLTHRDVLIEWPILGDNPDFDVEWQVLWRATDSEDWLMALPASPNQHWIMLQDLQPGDYSYQLKAHLRHNSDGHNLLDQEKDLVSKERLFSVRPGPHFSERLYSFSVERDYQQRRALTVVNPAADSTRIQLSVRNQPNDLALGFVGNNSTNQILELPPGAEVTVPLAIFAQDANPGPHTCTVALKVLDVAQATEDCVAIDIDVAGPRFAIEVFTGDPDPITLAVPIRIINRGQTITDLSVDVDHTAQEQVRWIPRISHANFVPGDVISSSLVPHLEPGSRGFSVMVQITGAGQKQELPISFDVPKSQETFVGLTHSTFTSNGLTWFCTNRPWVEGVIESSGSAPINTQPPNWWRKMRKLFVKDPGNPISGSSGVRGGVVRPSVAQGYQDLEKDNRESAHRLRYANGGGVAVWHQSHGRNQDVFFLALNADGELITQTNLSDSDGSSRWPTISGNPNSVLIAAWEDDHQNNAMEIVIRRSTDGGHTWGPKQPLSTTGEGCYDPILWEQNQFWFIAWEDTQNGIVLRRSDDQGVTWSQPIQVADGPLAWPQLAGSGQELCCVWENNSDQSESIWAAFSDDAGLTWSPAERLSKTDVAGEPSVIRVGDTYLAAWREGDGRHSEIMLRKFDGDSWLAPKALTDDEVPSEYPKLTAVRETLYLSYISSALGVIGPYEQSSTDLGENWLGPRRQQRQAGNVNAAILSVDFQLPHDPSRYQPHDVFITINGHQVAALQNTIPEGRYLFPVDPTLLNYAPGGTAVNKIIFDTRHLNGGHYVVSTGYKLIQFMDHQERTVVANDQQQADRLAQSLSGEDVNHDRPDAAIFANHLRGIPKDTTGKQKITIEVPIFNVGAVPLQGATVKCLAENAMGSRSLATEKVIEGTINPLDQHLVRFSFDHDGQALRVRLSVEANGPESNYRNNHHSFTIGKPGPGQLLIIANDHDEYHVAIPETGELVQKISSNEPLELPIGVYDLRDADGSVLHPQFGVRGDQRTELDIDGLTKVTINCKADLAIRLRSADTNVEANTNSPIRLPPGVYTVECNEPLIAQPFTVRKGRPLIITAEIPGQLQATGFHDRIMHRPTEVYDIHGNKVASSYGRIDLAPGTYTVRIQHGVAHHVPIQSGETTRVHLSNAGGIQITSDLPEINNHQFQVLREDGTVQGRIFVGTMVSVPPGTYTVKVLGQTFDSVTVIGDETTQRSLDQRLGCLAVTVDSAKGDQPEVIIHDANGTAIVEEPYYYRSGIYYLPAGTFAVTVILGPQHAKDRPRYTQKNLVVTNGEVLPVSFSPP